MPCLEDRKQNAFAVRKPVRQPVVGFIVGFIRDCQHFRSSAILLNSCKRTRYHGKKDNAVIGAPTCGAYLQIISQVVGNSAVDGDLFEIPICPETYPPIIRRKKWADATLGSRNGFRL